MAKIVEGMAQIAKINALPAGVAITSVAKQTDTHLTGCPWVEPSRIEYEKT